MKRWLAGLIALSLVLATAPPSAWAQFSEAARVVSGGGAVVVAAPVGAGVPGLPPALQGLVEPAAAAFVAPAAAAVAKNPAAADARGELNEAARALNAPDARPAQTLEVLFSRGVSRAVLPDGAAVPTPAGTASTFPSLPRASAPVGAGGPEVPGPSNAPRNGAPSRLARASKSVGRVALAAAAAVGLNAAAVALAPALFSVVPVAAAWAVSSGVLLFPTALYARYRLSKRDSPRLKKIKVFLDLALGVYVGALFVALPGLGLSLSGVGALAAALPAAGLAAGLVVRGAPFLNSVMVLGALALAPAALGAAAVGGLAVAPILGMLALPAMTTVAFFLGSLISSAETGRPFAVSGSLQKMRFPSFQWIMIGVVFAVTTGYAAVHATPAYLAWNILGMRSAADWDKAKPLWKNLLNKAADFDVLYLGLLAFVAVGGFSSPLTFLVIAFSGERAAVWAERLLARFLPRGEPAPSTRLAPHPDDSAVDEAPRWPTYHYWGKTFLILAAMAGIGAVFGATALRAHGLLAGALTALATSVVPFWYGTRIVKALMKDTAAKEEEDPEFFAIMRSLRAKINARTRAPGGKAVPMPEMVNDPILLPNAYATGRSPFHALVGVTRGLKEMTLDPENVREGVKNLIGGTAPGTKAFRVFRLAISGSIPGVTESSSSAEIQAAVLKADRVELKALGVRMLTGVLAHEFSHVMDRHMLSGAVAGAISSTIAFAAYGAMWLVGRGKILAVKAIDWIPGRRAPEPPPDLGEDEDAEGGSRKSLVDPITAGITAKSIPALFAILWVPAVVQIVQMASSRNNEGMADRDGATLSGEPESLALALGLLTSWRPKSGFKLGALDMPKLMAAPFLMTVNPLEQVAAAGALPKFGSLTEAVIGKSDDFLSDLFVTHPRTSVRIERLSDMAAAARAGKFFRGGTPR